MEASVSAPARKNRLLKVGKKPCIQRTYSANLRIRRRFGTMSRAGVPGAAERCGRALPEEIKACLLEEGVGRCGAVRDAGTSQSAHWLRAIRALRHGPLAHHGSRCWASVRQLGRRRILGRLAGGRRGAAWPLMHSAPACWRPTRRCLASNGTRRCLAGNRPTRSCVASDGKHTRTQTRSSRTHTDALVPNAARTELVPRR